MVQKNRRMQNYNIICVQFVWSALHSMLADSSVGQKRVSCLPEQAKKKRMTQEHSIGIESRKKEKETEHEDVNAS